MSATSRLEIGLEDFAATWQDEFLLDVRETGEYAAGHVPGAVSIPLGQLGGRIDELPRVGTVYVICATGNRSLYAARALSGIGVPAVSVAGGTAAWARSGRPVTTGLQAA
jgi:rhodanese-related sulfurtransferase